MQVGRKFLLALTLLALAPAAAFGQASITGIVKDTSGAVLPGVDVAASGPALLTPRAVQTDSSGIYRIIDLPPGTYEVAFTLSGFTKVVRPGVEVAGTAIVTIPVEMRLGGVSETITVVGET